MSNTMEIITLVINVIDLGRVNEGAFEKSYFLIFMQP